MKLALVVPVFPQLSETFIATKAIGLLDRGHDVHIVCTRSGPDHWGTYGAGHRVHELRGRVHLTAPTALTRDAPARLGAIVRSTGRHPSALGTYLRRADGPAMRRLGDLYLDSALLGLQPDVVHFEFGSLAVGRTGLRHRLGCALTVSFRGHDINFVGLDDPRHLDQLWATADGVHVLGESLWRRARERGAPPDLPHAVISPAVDAASVTVPVRRDGVLGTDDRPLRVVSVGRLDWTKGYEYGLEAVAGLRGRGIRVEHRIIGAGPLREAIEGRRRELGLEDRVDLVGAVEPGRVSEHYRWADVMLHTATSEGFCNAVLEAQAHGLPVVTSDAGGLGENVADGVTGTVVPRRHVPPLVDALIRYATEPALRLAVGRAGRDRAVREFGLDRQLDAWERFYRSASSRRSPVR